MSDSRKVEEVVELLNHLQFVPARKFLEREAEFVESLHSRAQEFGSKLYVSDKQLFWLRDIKGKYCDGIAPSPRSSPIKSEPENYGAREQTKSQRYDGDAEFDYDDIPF